MSEPDKPGIGRPVRGVLLDLDGTVYIGGVPIDGAPDAIARIRSAGLPIRFVTNTTRTSRAALVDQLGAMDIPVAENEIFSAPVATAAWLRAHGIRRIRLLLPEATHADFADFELGTDEPEAVVVGDLGSDWTFDALNRSFRDVIGGARLVAIQRNRYWMSPDGLMLDTGPFVAALEYAAGVAATVVGKPTPEFFLSAVMSLGVDSGEALMVGDDVASDVMSAQAAGLQGCLVKTGKFRESDLTDHNPDHVLRSIARLPRLLRV